MGSFLNILSYRNNFDAILDYTNYWDMEIVYDEDVYRTDICGDGVILDGMGVWIDTNNSGSTIFSGNPLVSVTCLNNSITSGFTLNDVGLTAHDNGRLLPFSGITGLSISYFSGDTCLKLYPVSGQTYDYFIDKNLEDFSGKYYKFCGGFYQGIFKLYDYPYEVIPPRNLGGWTHEFILNFSGCSHGTTGITLNNLYPNNSGFFFYIGSRAENKFWNVIHSETGKTTTDGVLISPTGSAELNLINDVNPFLLTGVTSTSNVNVGGNPFLTNPICKTSSGATTQPYQNINPNLDIVDNAIGFRVTSSGKIGYRKITTSGMCVNDIFVTGVTIEESYSTESIYTGTTNNWIHIVITFCPYKVFNNETELDCDSTMREGILTFWVNGRKVLKKFNFKELLIRELNTDKTKQQLVPYNISIGGGSQGLLENITFNGVDNEDKELTIEKNFAGTFDGGFSQYRYYLRCLNFTEVLSNFNAEKSRYNFPDTFGGRIIIVTNNNC